MTPLSRFSSRLGMTLTELQNSLENGTSKLFRLEKRLKGVMAIGVLTN